MLPSSSLGDGPARHGWSSKSHLNAETQAFIDGIEGPIELVQAGGSLKFLKIAEGLADVYPRLGPTCEWFRHDPRGGARCQGLGHGPGRTGLKYGKDDILNPYFVVRGP